MNGVLHLSPALAGAILEAARGAYPEECCGLIEGVDAPDGWRALAVHAAANLAQDRAHRFLIDPQAQFDLMRRLRGSEARLIACYHSHPNGAAEPSARDRAEAYEPGLLYLIAAGAPERGFALGAFVFAQKDEFRAIAIRSDSP
jgi:proteasome lid subunit RPN8/RPN11